MGMWDEYRARVRRELEALNNQATDLGRRALRPLDGSPVAKAEAGAVSGLVGQILGAGRGVVHDAQAIGNGAAFAVDLPSVGPPRKKAAVQAVKNAANGAADYVSSRKENPGLLLDDARSYG